MALAPFITDVPIILVSVFVMAQLSHSQVAFGLISIIGAAVLVYLAYLTFRVERVSVELPTTEARSIAKGVLVNFFSPNPYVFWLTVGAPQVVEAWTDSHVGTAFFLGGFYVCLVGSKMMMAFVAGRSKQLLAGAAYRFVMRTLGVALLVLALLLLRDGFVFLQVLDP